MLGAELGVPVDAQDEDPHRVAGPRDVTQQQQGRPGRPLQVIENQQGGAILRHRGEPAGHRIEESVALGLGVRAQRSRHVGKQLRQLGQESSELAAVAPQPRGQNSGGGLCHHMPQGFDEGLVRNAEVLLATPGEHRGPGCANSLGQFAGQAGLPDTGLANHQRHARARARHLLPQLLKPRQFRAPSDEDPGHVREQAGKR